MNRSITIRTGLRLRHLDELEDLDIRSHYGAAAEHGLAFISVH
jgi:hypothetical protein